MIGKAKDAKGFEITALQLAISEVILPTICHTGTPSARRTCVGIFQKRSYSVDELDRDQSPDHSISFLLFRVRMVS